MEQKRPGGTETGADEKGSKGLALIVKVVVSKNLYSCFDRLSDIVLYLT